MKKLLLIAGLVMASYSFTHASTIQNDDDNAQVVSVKNRKNALMQSQEDQPAPRKQPAHTGSSIKDRINKLNQHVQESQNHVHTNVAKPSQKISACVHHAERVAEKEVPKFIGDLYDYLKGSNKKALDNEAFNAFSKGEKEDQVNMLADQLSKRHADAIKKAPNRAAFVEEVMDPSYCMKGRKDRMDKAETKKEALINEYKTKNEITEANEAYLAAEGVLYDRKTHTFKKTADKFMDLKSCWVPNPANVDAFAWFIPWVKGCREADHTHPAHVAHAAKTKN